VQIGCASLQHRRRQGALTQERLRIAFAVREEPVANLPNIPKAKILRRTGKVGKVHVDRSDGLVFCECSPQELFEQQGLANTPQAKQRDVLHGTAMERQAIVGQLGEFALAVGEKALLIEWVKVVYV
jgi:hypothetical protein